jgi:hypothetical protein
MDQPAAQIARSSRRSTPAWTCMIKAIMQVHGVRRGRSRRPGRSCLQGRGEQGRVVPVCTR